MQWFSRPPPSTTRRSLPPSQAYISGACFGPAGRTTNYRSEWTGFGAARVLKKRRTASTRYPLIRTTTQQVFTNCGPPAAVTARYCPEMVPAPDTEVANNAGWPGLAFA